MTKKGVGQAAVSRHDREARPRHSAGARHYAHDTTIGRCDTARQGAQRRGVERARHDAQGRACERCDTAACALRYGHAGLRHGRGLVHDMARHSAGAPR